MDGQKLEATVRVLNPNGNTGLSPFQILLGSADLDDGKRDLDESNIIGAFSLSLGGVFTRTGEVTTGTASGTTSMKGVSAGEMNITGSSFLLFPPKRKGCTCE